jgi:hypothetical protein
MSLPVKSKAVICLFKSLLVPFCFLLCFPHILNAEVKLDDVSKRLAFCTSVFPYAANLFMMQNNEGAAKIMLFHHARATMTLFSIHSAGGRTSGEKIEAFKTEGQKAKPFLDAYPGKLSKTIDDCFAITNEYAIKQSKKNIKIQGKDFDTLVEEMAAKSRDSLGIR